MRPRLSAAAAAFLLLACCRVPDSVAQNDTLSKHEKPTPPPDPPREPKLPRARCLTPEGKPRDFEDLVRSKCNPPKTPPLPPAKKKGNGTAAPNGLTVSTRPAPGYDDNPECERGLTVSELQRNIINATDQLCVAQILIQTASMGGIEGGFRIDPDFNFRPNCGKRELDPDVIALKGILLGLLQGVPEDEAVFDKVVDGVVPSFTPEEMMKSTKYEDKKDKSVDRDAFAELLRDRDLLLEAFNEDPNNTPPCYKPPPPKKYPSPPPYSPPPYSPPPPSPAPYSPPPYSPPPPSPAPYSPAPPSPSTYLPSSSPPYEAPPPTYSSGSGRRLLSSGRPLDELLVGSSRRGLKCADCDNADSFPCSYCWQQSVCGDLYWCQ